MPRARALIEALVPEPRALLVIVHPGSLCGAYHTSHAFEPKRLAALLREMSSWKGDVAVVHGDLSDELEVYNEVGRVIQSATRGASVNEYSGSSERELVAVARRIDRQANVAKYPLVLVTGAWGGTDGCATTVADELKRLGANVRLSSHLPIF